MPRFYRLIVAGCLLLSFALSATTTLAQSQAEARADLQQLRERYESGTSLEADVRLEIMFPEQPVEVQEGHITQQGESFRVEFDGQHIISDGETVWMFLPDNQEVQVYAASESTGLEGGGFMRPQDILTIYDSDGFEYAVIGEVEEDGKSLRQIEFKPTDRASEYAKIRLTYDPADKEVRRVQVFNKDGSRFALSLTSLTTGTAFTAEQFVFDAEKYPGVTVEDMRL